MTNEQIKTLQAKADGENAGKIDFETFKDFIFEGKKIQKTDEEIEAAFRVFDNGQQRGLIDVESFRHALTTLGDKMTREEVDEIIREARKLSGDDEDPSLIDYVKLMRLIQSVS